MQCGNVTCCATISLRQWHLIHTLYCWASVSACQQPHSSYILTPVAVNTSVLTVIIITIYHHYANSACKSYLFTHLNVNDVEFYLTNATQRIHVSCLALHQQQHTKGWHKKNQALCAKYFTTCQICR